MKRIFHLFLTALLLTICQAVSAQDYYLVGNEPIGNGWGGTITPKAMAKDGTPRKFVVFEDETFFVTTSNNPGNEASFNETRYAVTANNGRIAAAGDYDLVLDNDGITTLSAGTYEFEVINDGGLKLRVTMTPISDYSSLVDYTPALIKNDEQSIFLRTKAQTSPYVYASNPDGSEFAPWPGQKMSLVGKEAGNTDYYIYKWVSPYSTNLHHSSLTINDGTSNRSTAKQTTFAPYVRFNHHIYNMEDEEYGEITDGGEITAVTPRTAAPKNAVIYEMSLANFAGNFNAAKNKINDLAENGITIISLMPIYLRDTNSKDPYSMMGQYDTAYGSFDDLKAFITAAHDAGIKVLLDVVVDRTSTQATWVTEYPKFYKRDNNGQMIHPVINGVEATDQYALDLNYTGTQWTIVNSLSSVMKQLGSAASGNFSDSFDGFRIDNASAIPAPSVSRALNALHALNPSLIILGDIELIDEDPVYHQVGYDYDYAKKLQSTMLANIGDGSTPEQLSKVNDFVNGLKEASAFTNIVPRTLYTTNHVLNKTKSQSELYGANEKALTVLTYTIPGIPMIYNGQETGYLTNNKIDYTGNGIITDGGDGAMKTLIKALGDLRKSNEAMSADVDVKLKNTNIVDGGVVAFTREYNGDEVLVLFNLSNTDRTDVVVNDVQQATWKSVLEGNNQTAVANGADLVFDQNTKFDLPANSYKIYQLNDFFTAEQKGWYLHPQNDPKGMEYKFVDKGNNEYEINISARKFYEMSQNNDNLVFDLKEITNVDDKWNWAATSVAPATNLTEVNANGVDGNDRNDGNKFKISAVSGANLYTLTLKVNGDGSYKLKVTTITESLAGIYLASQGNDEGSQVPAYQLSELTDEEEGFTHHILITKDQFDTFSAGDVNHRLFFHLVVYTNVDGTTEKNTYYVSAQEKNGYTFEDSKEGSRYDECAWENSPRTNFFVLENLKGYASYDIRFMVNERQNITYLKVVYTKDYTWNGAKTDDVEATLNDAKTGLEEQGKNVYLYNVDTGMFLWNRGEWGTQAMTPYSSFGMRLKLINTTDVEAKYQNGQPNYGTEEKPSYAFYTASAANPDNATQGSFLGYDNGKYHEGFPNRFWVDRGGNLNENDNETRDKQSAFRWHLYPVKSGNDEATTYLLSVDMYPEENYNQRKEFFVNVAMDEVQGDLALQRRDVNIGDLRDADGQPLDLARTGNYRWQLVTEEELLAAFENGNADAYGGMYTDATFLFDNPDFARGLERTIVDNKTWKKNDGITYNYNQVGDNGKDGKYYYAQLTGQGSLEQDSKMPVSGVYEINLNGFSTGTDANNAKIKVVVENGDNDLTYEKELINIDNDEYNDVKNNYREAAANDKNDGYSIGKTLYVDDQTNYLNTLYFYVPEISAASTGDVKVYIEKTNGNGTVVVDNFRATYLGEAPFVLDPKSRNVDYINNETEHTKIPVYINRQFLPGAWQALVLPFDVTVAQLKQAFGNGVKLSKQNGLSEDDLFNILFKSVNLESPTAVAINAGEFYLVNPAVARTVTEVIQRDGTNLTPKQDEATGFISLGFHNMKDLTLNNTYVTSEVQTSTDHNALRYVGLYAQGIVPTESYVFYNNKTTLETALHHIDRQVPLDGFRFYIQDVTPGDAPAKEIKYIIDDDEELIDGGDGTLTPVDRVVEDGADNVKREGIYTISGQRVSGDVKDLPNGLYIINGEKVLISNK